jgi:hypothetical protein
MPQRTPSKQRQSGVRLPPLSRCTTSRSRLDRPTCCATPRLACDAASCCKVCPVATVRYYVKWPAILPIP